MVFNFIQFVFVDNGGIGDVIVALSNFVNGVVEWISFNLCLQVYKVICSVCQSFVQNCKYIIKVEVFKVVIQIVGGVEFFVAVWCLYLNMELIILIFVMNLDCGEIGYC